MCKQTYGLGPPCNFFRMLGANILTIFFPQFRSALSRRPSLHAEKLQGCPRLISLHVEKTKYFDRFHQPRPCRPNFLNDPLFSVQKPFKQETCPSLVYSNLKASKNIRDLQHSTCWKTLWKALRTLKRLGISDFRFPHSI